MTTDDLIQEMAVRIYETPLAMVRDEVGFPDLGNPFHLLVLLIDCDTEIAMNGVIGFLENLTGQHLGATIKALRQIGAPKAAGRLQAVSDCMARYGVTWERLRVDINDCKEFDITSSKYLHGIELEPFISEVSGFWAGSSLFSSLPGEEPYDALCAYLDVRFSELQRTIQTREIQP